MQEDFQKYVRSYVPGRMRIRHPGLVGLSAEDQKGIADYLQAIEGVRGVQINAVVGSLLLYWDPSRLSEADIDQYAAMFASMLPEPALAARRPAGRELAAAGKELRRAGIGIADKVACCVAPGIKRGKRARRVAHNRIMLGMLGSSLGCMCLKNGAHAAFGWGFALMLAYHLYQHRKVL